MDVGTRVRILPHMVNERMMRPSLAGLVGTVKKIDNYIQVDLDNENETHIVFMLSDEVEVICEN